jgi:hypothetical protein
MSSNAYEFFRDYIPRYTSSAVTVFHGAAKGESPKLTTMWTVLGFPLSSIAVPVWINEEALLPSALTGGEDNKSLICSMSLDLKDKLFPVKRGSGYKYMNISALVNAENRGILQRIIPIEKEIIRKAEDLIVMWRREGMNQSQLAEFYDWIDDYIMSKFSNEFIELKDIKNEL